MSASLSPLTVGLFCLAIAVAGTADLISRSWLLYDDAPHWAHCLMYRTRQFIRVMLLACVGAFGVFLCLAS